MIIIIIIMSMFLSIFHEMMEMDFPIALGEYN